MNTEKSIPLAEWLKRATLEQRKQLYAGADTSMRSLWQVVTGRRGITAEKAAEIETATKAINGLPPALRTTTCAVCGECPFAKQGDAVLKEPLPPL